MIIRVKQLHYLSNFQAHLNELDSKTKAMIQEVNAAIGEGICLDVPDVLITSGSAGMFGEGSKVNLKKRCSILNSNILLLR